MSDISLIPVASNNFSSSIISPKNNTETSPINLPTEESKNILPDNNIDVEDDNASVLVIILQCETKPCDKNIINLKWIFSDPYFTVQVCSVDFPTNIPTIKTLTPQQYVENYFMKKALTYAAEGPYIPNTVGKLEPQFWWSKNPVIIVKDSSISNITSTGKLNSLKLNNKLSNKLNSNKLSNEKLSDDKIEDTLLDNKEVENKLFDNKEVENNSDTFDDIDDEIIGGMKRRIKLALERANEADLFFLCKWNDACNKYTDVEGGNNVNYGSSLKWSVQPTATQAIMYTATARDYIRDHLSKSIIPLGDTLNINIAKGDLLATVFVPNIIDFDIELATSNEDYNKLNECAPVPSTSQSNNNAASLIWFAVVLLLMILVAWALVQLNPQTYS